MKIADVSKMFLYGIKLVTFEINTLVEVRGSVNTFYLNNNRWRFAPGSMKMISYLWDREIPAGVVTHFLAHLDQQLRRVYRSRRIFKFIQMPVIGEGEPSGVKAFQELIKTAQIPDLKPSEILHIGGSTTFDYFAARNAGVNGIVINPFDGDEIANFDNIKREHIFRNLDSLLQHILKYDYHDVNKLYATA